MAACEFDQPFKGSAADLVAKAKEGIQANGGTFSGDVTQGSFSVRGVVGTYTVHDQTAHFVITSKPFLVPCRYIQSTLNGYVNPRVASKKKPGKTRKAGPAKKAGKARRRRPASRVRKSRPARRARRGSNKR